MMEEEESYLVERYGRALRRLRKILHKELRASGHQSYSSM